MDTINTDIIRNIIAFLLDNEQLANQMGIDDDTLYDANEKYCERCMVRRMYELFYAEDENGDYLPMSAPEWQAIINY